MRLFGLPEPDPDAPVSPAASRRAVRALGELERLLVERADLLDVLEVLGEPGPGDRRGAAVVARLRAEAERLARAIERVLATLAREVPPTPGHRSPRRPDVA